MNYIAAMSEYTVMDGYADSEWIFDRRQTPHI